MMMKRVIVRITSKIGMIMKKKGMMSGIMKRTIRKRFCIIMERRGQFLCSVLMSSLSLYGFGISICGILHLAHIARF
jgi:hypothetical protein